MKKNVLTAVPLVILLAIAGAGGRLFLQIPKIAAASGADMVLLPSQAAQGSAYSGTALLSVIQNYNYIERNVLLPLEHMDDIERMSAQFFLTSAGDSCCEFPVQVIGFEPETDFTVLPQAKKGSFAQLWRSWRSLQATKSSKAAKSARTAKAAQITRTSKKRGVLVAGSNVSVQDGGVTVFSKRYRVSAVLEPTGTATDNSILMDYNTLYALFDDATEKGFNFVSDGDPEERVSAVFIRLKAGASAEQLSLCIKSEVPGVQLVYANQSIKKSAERLLHAERLACAVTLLSVLGAALLLARLITEIRSRNS